MALWKLRTLREAGKRRTSREIEADPGVAGYFRMSYQGRGGYRVLTFYPRAGIRETPRETRQLYQPEIVSFMESGLRVRGFERCGEAAVVQEWLCDVV